ncbi:MAG: DUF4276 family protein [Candidatus Symbiobacter sp.]|nr:DUF4276 family protein [Candidatus Symbiobacter sp.]
MDNNSNLPQLVFLVEDESLKQFIASFLSVHFPQLTEEQYDIIEFGGKESMIKPPRRRDGEKDRNEPALLVQLRAYAATEQKIIIVIDLDDDFDDQHLRPEITLKSKLEEFVAKVKLLSRKNVNFGEKYRAITRIAVIELESWFLAHPDAVCKVYPNIKPSDFTKPFHYPKPRDSLGKIIRDAGYHRGYGKRDCDYPSPKTRAGEFGKHMPLLLIKPVPKNREHHSFYKFCHGIDEIVRGAVKLQ